jgi:mono/diheme cytochrome c family protein
MAHPSDFGLQPRGSSVRLPALSRASLLGASALTVAIVVAVGVRAGGIDDPTSLPATVGEAAKAAAEKAAAAGAGKDASKSEDEGVTRSAGEKPEAKKPKPPPKKSGTPSDTTMPTKRPSDHVRGKELWSSACWQCHGAQGLGDGPAAASLVGGVPDLTTRVVTGDTEEIAREGALVDVIQDGRGRMPAYSEVIDRADSRRILIYVRDVGEGRGDPDAKDDKDGDDDNDGDAPGGEGQ